MIRHILELSYDGSQFCGWQVQPQSPSVEASIEDAICTLTGLHVQVTGAGRTDTKVNAVNYRAHFETEESLPMSYDDFTYKINAIVPPSVVVHRVFRDDSLHARFSATARTYKYFVHFHKDPFLAPYSYWSRYPLDMEAMNAACGRLLGTKDFSCFEKVGGNNKTSVCTVTGARWERYVPGHVQQLGFPGDDYIVFTITADRFLRNMVRAIVGSCLEVGHHRRQPEWFDELLASRDRRQASQSVPGHALFLCKIEY